MFTSTNGRDWQKAHHFEVCKKELRLPDGSLYPIDRMERPSVFIERGEVTMLSFAVMKGNDALLFF